MMGLIDSIGDVLSRAERRVEVAGQNVANSSTPGYKRAVGFEVHLANATRLDGSSAAKVDGLSFAIDITQGQLENTGNLSDLAISGAGYFKVRTESGRVLYTRQGQFQLDQAGHLVNAQGGVLQTRDGGDLVIKSGDYKVLLDGTVVQQGMPLGRIAIDNISDSSELKYEEGGLYTIDADKVEAMDASIVYQGMLEASNVSLGTEMLSVMTAMRQAQSGQRIMSVYDDLLGRAISSLGQG